MEIIAVLIILGILAAVAVPRYMAFEANAKKKVFNKSINELNALETLEWSDNKISESGYVSDIKIYGAINSNHFQGIFDFNNLHLFIIYNNNWIW